MVMDIEQMKKINAMSKVLQQHGFASHADEAMIQSHHIYGPSHVYEMPSSAGMATQQIEVTQQSAPQHNAQTPESSLGFINESFTAVEKFQKESQERFEALESNMAQVFTKVNEMIAALKEIQEAKHEAVVVKTAEQPQTTLREQPAQQAQPVEQKHHRTGDFKPGDIDLNKVFYCGK